MKDKKYYLYDIESGYKFEVTKERHEAYMKAWEAARPKIDSIKGSIMIYGTMGNMEEGSLDLKDIFYSPEFKLK